MRQRKAFPVVYSVNNEVLTGGKYPCPIIHLLTLQGYGVKSGLAFALKASEIDLDYLCRGPVQGFKVFLISEIRCNYS